MEDIIAREFITKQGDSITTLDYNGNVYYKTTAQTGTITTYSLGGTDITSEVEVQTVVQAFDSPTPLVALFKDPIVDNLGNYYQICLLPKYEVLQADTNDVPTLVGRQPGGRFGGK